MPLIKNILDKTPQISPDCYVAENATIIGDVVIGEKCSIWFNAVIRGDVNSIHIGHHSNVQDGAVIHCTYNKTKTIIGNYVSIGHNAIVHGCTIEDHVLIGMGSIIMDNVIVDSGSIIAAGAVVTQGKHIKKGEIWAGTPAKKIKTVSPELEKDEIMRIAQNYTFYSSWYK